MSVQPTNWLTLHPKVKAALAVFVLIVIGTTSGALNGTETWNVAFLADATAALTGLAAYIKSS